jgi:hypothetical protein
MGTGGLEPPRLLQQRILSPSCLPISPHSHNIMYMVTENYLESKIIVFYSESRPFKVTNKFLTELEVICIM